MIKHLEKYSFKKGMIPWNKNRIDRICVICSTNFTTNLYQLNRTGAKYCSRKCYWQNLTNKKPKNMEGLKLGRYWNLGKGKKYYCVICNKQINNKSHGKPKYCIECLPKAKIMIAQNNGHKNKGKIAWNKGKPAPWANWKVLFKLETRKKALKNSYKARYPRRRMSKAEIKFNEFIKENKLPYKFVGDGAFFIEGKNPDFININGEKKAIDIFYKKHKEFFLNKRNKTFDTWVNERKLVFKKYGWSLFLIDIDNFREEEVKNYLKKGV